MFLAMTIFVTGIQSFIGLAFARLCRSRGVEVVGVDAAPVTEPGAVTADIRSPAIADLIPHGASAIVHLAALSRDPDCRDRGYACFDVNVQGTLNLMEAAKVRGVKQFIFASSEWVYDSFRPGEERDEESPIDATRLTSEYAFSKFVSENNLRQQAIHGFCPATVLRFGIVYGPRTANWCAAEALLNAVATQEEVKVGALATARRFIHVRDIAESLLAAVGWQRPYDVFNIQGPALVTLGDVISASAELLGRQPRIVETAPQTPSLRTVSSRKATEVLGWSAAVDLRTGLADVAEFLGLTGTRP
ncbi:MAG: NAD-dependent epimerase/dehydratase family protein [Alphaproteobacteria bacterium]